MYGIRAPQNNKIRTNFRADNVYVKNIEIYNPFTVRIPHMRKKTYIIRTDSVFETNFTESVPYPWKVL